MAKDTPDADDEQAKTYVGDVAKGRSVGGRPPKYETVAELEAVIDDYFNNHVPVKTVIVGPPNKRYPVDIPVPTITGLAIHMGFNSRQSIYNYEGKAEFLDTIKKARAFIEQHYEELLQTGNTVGAIFALKNFGWLDKGELALTNPDGSLNPYGQLSTDELRALLKKG